MSSLAPATDLRVREVFAGEDRLTVELMDGRAISVPLAWYPRLAKATGAQLSRWEVAGGGYGIHWPEIDEDLSTERAAAGRACPWHEPEGRSSMVPGPYSMVQSVIASRRRSNPGAWGWV